MGAGSLHGLVLTLMGNQPTSMRERAYGKSLKRNKIASQTSYICVIWNLSGKQSEMYPSEEFWLIAVLSGVIAGVTTVVLSKLWENIGALIDTGAGNKSEKLPQEHDERF